MGVDRSTNDDGFADSGQVTAERGEVEALVGSLTRDARRHRRRARQDRRGHATEPASSAASRSAKPASRPCRRRGSASSARRRVADRTRAAMDRDNGRSSSSRWSSSIILHEIAHGVVALWFGDDTAKRAGRLTLNPIPHIDPFGSIILPAIGRPRGRAGHRVGEAGARRSQPAAQPPSRHVVGLARRSGHQLLLMLVAAVVARMLYNPRFYRIGCARQDLSTPGARCVGVRAGEPLPRRASTCCRSHRSTAPRCSSACCPRMVAGLVSLPAVRDPLDVRARVLRRCSARASIRSS